MTQGKEKLTIEKLKKYPGLENLTDEQAANCVDTIGRLADILYRCYMEKERKRIRDEKESLKTCIS